MREAVVVGGARTAIGRLLGGLSELSAAQLGGVAIKAALDRAGIPGNRVDYVIMGQVLQAGAGQIPSRQAAVAAGIPMSVPSLTINKVCLSGLDAIALAAQLIRAGEFDVVVAGGMESMSRAPHLLPAARRGIRYGPAELADSMALDGLTDAFDHLSMGESTERHVARLGITRAEQDEYAARSHQRAAAAVKNGLFAEEIAPVPVRARAGEPAAFDTDEGVRPDTTAESLGRLRPAFAPDGTITAGSASQISDGAGARGAVRRRPRPDRDQRGVGGRGHPVHARPRGRPGAGERERRRDRARPPDRDVGRADPVPPDLRAAQARRRARGRGAVRRRRPGRRAARARPRAGRQLSRVGGQLAGGPPAAGAGALAPGPAGAGQRRADELVAAARAGDPRALARLVSLVEDGSDLLRPVMRAVAAHAGHARVIGLTGSPGVGKSTLTGALVGRFRGRGLRVGVLAVDPTSPFSGGALLGDRVRMSEHATDPGVFIRSLASRGHLGGLSAAAPQALRVVDAAGFDVVCVETVGVGQAEVEIASLADTTLVIMAPGMGDSIQAAKAGILEVADVFVVNKCDRPGAQEVVRDLRAMLALAPRGPGRWRPPIVAVSAQTGEGIDELAGRLDAHLAWLEESGELARRRLARAREEISGIVVAAIRARIGGLPGAGRSRLRELAEKVAGGALDPYAAADELLGEQGAGPGPAGPLA